MTKRMFSKISHVRKKIISLAHARAGFRDIKPHNLIAAYNDISNNDFHRSPAYPSNSNALARIRFCDKTQLSSRSFLFKTMLSHSHRFCSSTYGNTYTYKNRALLTLALFN